MSSPLTMLTGLTAGLLLVSPGQAQSDEADAEDLAMQLANPVSSLISLPFQYNYDEWGSQDLSRHQLNIQPVAPFQITDNLNLISRTILPVIDAEYLYTDPGMNQTEIRSASGIGDVVQSVFISPVDTGPGGLIWGAGPVFYFPTASDDRLGTDKWGVGPTAVVLKQTPGGWTFGGLANHIWSFAGDGPNDINASFLQPFINYTTDNATSFFLNTEATYDWESENWSVPVNFGANQLIRVGNQSMQLGLGGRYWLESPTGGPEGWGLRANLVFLFPT